MRLCLGCFLHRAASHGIEPRFRLFLPGHFRTRPVPAVIGSIGQLVATAHPDDGVYLALGIIEHPHLRHGWDIGRLSIPPQGEDRFCHRRGGFSGVVDCKSVLVAIQCRDVSRCALVYPYAICKSLRCQVPQVNRIAVAFNGFVVIDMEHHGNRLFFGLLEV